MALSCYCDSEYDWYYKIDNNEMQCQEHCKCYGCGKKLSIGDTAREMQSWEIDEHGDEIEPYDTRLICEQCGDMYDNLNSLGYCIGASPGFVKKAHKEYLAMLPPTHILKGRKK